MCRGGAALRGCDCELSSGRTYTSQRRRRSSSGGTGGSRVVSKRCRHTLLIPASTAAAVAAATLNRALPSAGGSHPVPRASHWALPTGGHTTQPHANTPAKVWVVTLGYQLAGDLGRRPRANRAGGLRAVRMGLRLTQSLPRGHRWKWLGRRRAGPRQAAASGLTGHCHADSR
mgnify:CR=1 FL=1